MGAGACAGKQDKWDQPGAIHEVPGLREIDWDLSPLPRAAVESFREVRSRLWVVQGQSERRTYLRVRRIVPAPHPIVGTPLGCRTSPI
jgi:hypothetical protein